MHQQLTTGTPAGGSGADPIATAVEVLRLYEAGQFLDAYNASAPLGGPAAWAQSSLEARNYAAALLAGRVANHCGGGRIGAAAHLRAFRHAAERGDVAVFAIYQLLGTRGPWAAWTFFKERGDDPGPVPTEVNPGHLPPPDSHQKCRAHWLAARGHARAFFRDFRAAEADIGAAHVILPDDAWCHVEHAAILQLQDRYEEALAAAERACTLRDTSVAAIHSHAHALMLLGRREEAQGILTDATARLQSGLLWMLLGETYRDQQQVDAEAVALEKALAFMPMLDESTDRLLARSLAARRSDIAYRGGDLSRAVELAEIAAGPANEDKPLRSSDETNRFWRDVIGRLKQRLAEPDAANYLADRKQLAVPFIRQHHATCAPATLASIARFWERESEHLEIAETICYDGTPWHSERDWAEQNGYVAREFTVTFDTAADLIDRGLPFTLTTIQMTTGHAQAVIGYDRTRRSLLLREPSSPSVVEIDADSLMDRNALWGPRGMTMVPETHRQQLDGVNLGNTDIYDGYRAFNKALERHDRDAAVAALRQIHSEHIDPSQAHPLALLADMTLASYDADPLRELSVLEAILERFPDAEPMLMRRVTLLGVLGRDSDAREALEETAADPKRDGVFAERLASMLAEDARQSRRVRRLLRRQLRFRPREANLYLLLGRTLWSQATGSFSNGNGSAKELRNLARDAYRFAASLDDKSEHLTSAWVAVERFVGDGEAALDALKARAAQWGHKSAGPSLTLYYALREVGRVNEGLAELDAAIERLPEDSELLLQTATAHAEYGNADRGREYLNKAKPRARRVDWLAACAEVETLDGRLEEARRRWTQVAEIEPLNLWAQEQVARRTEELNGPAAAAAYLGKVCQRFPHHMRLQSIHYERLRSQDPAAAEGTLRRILETDQDDAWAHRELAIFLLVHKRELSPTPITPEELDEARRLLDRAQELDPRHPAIELARSELFAALSDMPAARKAAWRAVEIDPDSGFAISRFLQCCEATSDARDGARALADLLASAPISGDGLLAFAGGAASVVPAEELRDRLREFNDRRPDLWQAWVVLSRQELGVGHVEAGRQVAREATERFPLVAATWLALAQTHHAALDRDEEEVALKQALKVSPMAEVALLSLADLYSDAGEMQRALEVLDGAIARMPRNATLAARRAAVLWVLATDDAAANRAIAAAQAALEIDPTMDYVYGALEQWNHQLGRPQAAADFVRRLSQKRPGDVDLRLALARTLAAPATVDEALATLEEVLHLQPRNGRAHDLKAELLAQLRRYPEARAACRPACYDGSPPDFLRGREAWVVAESGDLKAAQSLMREVLRDWPSYFWGWRQLAIWARASDDLDGFEEAAKQMVKVSPQEPDALLWAGHAALARASTVIGPAADKFVNEARAHFEHALALDVTNYGCGSSLMDLHLDTSKPDKAAEVLNRLRPHLYPAQALARDIEIAAARSDADAARQFARQLCVEQHPDAGPATAAIEAIRRHLQQRRALLETAQQGFLAALSDPHLNSVVAYPVFAWLATDRKFRKARSLLKSLEDKNQEAWEHGASGYLSVAGESAGRLAGRFAAKHRNRIVAGTGPAADELWGYAGYAFTCAGRHREAIKLLSEYEQREHLKPWMLVNLAQAYASLRQWPAVLDSAMTTLQLPPDHSFERLLLWAAMANLQVDAPEASERAAELLEPVHAAHELPPVYRMLFHLVSAVTIADRSADAQAGLIQARDQLRQAMYLPLDWRRDRFCRTLIRWTRVRIHRRIAGFPLFLSRLRNLIS